LEALAKKLRKESEALQRVEASRKMANSDTAAAAAAASPTTVVAESMLDPMKMEPATPTPTKISTTTTTPAPPVTSSSTSVMYVPIDKFAFDDGGYSGQFVTLYIDLPGVGGIDKNNITCHFTKDSFDLIVKDLRGKSYRLFKDNLEHDIVPESSKKVVKADKILVKLAKKKSEYGSFDHWSSLTAKKSKLDKKANKDNPTAGIMDLMKEMYETGDDNMRKVIGETMMKQQTGQLGDGMGGIGDMDL